MWYCPPGEAHAEKFGLRFWVWSSDLISWTFQQNFVWLEDYLELEPQAVDNKAAEEVSTLVQENVGITLAELLQRVEIATSDDLYILIATEQVYVDLNVVRLAEPEQVKIFQNKEIACAFGHVNEVEPIVPPSNLRISRIAVGTSLSWDGECWQVANTGDTTTLLLRHDSKFVDLPNAAFDALLQQGKIISAEETQSFISKGEAEDILRRARPQDITEANRRYQILLPYLCDNPPPYPSSTIRRWRDQYRLAEKLYRSGYIGLLPSHSAKGNSERKLNEEVLTLMDQFIDERYENLKQRRIQRAYQDFVEVCKSHEPKLIPPCRKTFTRAIKKRAGYKQTLKREGRRAALQKEEFYWELEQTTPRHGNRPFEIAHIDHTKLDVELLSSLASLSLCNIDLRNGAAKHNLGCPWATFMEDAYSRRLLAVYVTYEEPSYRSCMMAIRICVQRFNRFPQILVMDNGAEFHSIYFEQLLATYVCTKKYRPPAAARFGSVVERLFGTANTQFIHELQGNTQIMRKYRQMTKSTSPEKLAVWTLAELYEALCAWAYEIYDQREHPALGQSPRNAFASGLALGGERLHKRVDYDDFFRILTLPAPNKVTRKVQPGHGIKIHNIYYWSNTFRNPEIERTSVEVRYDPFDAGIAYALVQGQWVKCISAYHQYLQGRTEKEIRLASAELSERKRKQQRNNVSVNSDQELVKFLNSLEAKEGKFLEQRLKAIENKAVLQVIEGVHNKQGDYEEGVEQAMKQNDLGGIDSEPTTPSEFSSQDDEDNLDNLEYYEEF